MSCSGGTSSTDNQLSANAAHVGQRYPDDQVCFVVLLTHFCLVDRVRGDWRVCRVKELIVLPVGKWVLQGISDWRSCCKWVASDLPGRILSRAHSSVASSKPTVDDKHVIPGRKICTWKTTVEAVQMMFWERKYDKRKLIWYETDAI